MTGPPLWTDKAQARSKVPSPETLCCGEQKAHRLWADALLLEGCRSFFKSAGLAKNSFYLGMI
jgi:hypothetical protein